MQCVPADKIGFTFFPNHEKKQSNQKSSSREKISPRDKFSHEINSSRDKITSNDKISSSNTISHEINLSGVKIYPQDKSFREINLPRNKIPSNDKISPRNKISPKYKISLRNSPKNSPKNSPQTSPRTSPLNSQRISPLTSQRISPLTSPRTSPQNSPRNKNSSRDKIIFSKKFSPREKKYKSKNKLEQHYLLRPIMHEDLVNQGNGIADRFKNILLATTHAKIIPNDFSQEELLVEKLLLDTKKNWTSTMLKLYNKLDITNLYQYWLSIYNKIKTTPSIHDQNKYYSLLTADLNPGQLLQCDFYKAIQTFIDYGFQIVHVKENLSRYYARQFNNCANDTFKFIVKKNNWIAKVGFTDDSNCVAGILCPKNIIDINTGLEYEGEDFYAWNSYEKNIKCMLRMFDVGYEAMTKEFFGDIIMLTNFLSKENLISQPVETKNNMCRYFADWNRLYYVIATNNTNNKLYLHISHWDKRLFLSCNEYIFVDNYDEGLHFNSKGRYYTINFNDENDIPKVNTIIQYFIKIHTSLWNDLFLQ